MKRSDFESMSADELWTQHEKIAAKLVVKICAEQRAIGKRLSLLVIKSERRPYPIVQVQKSGRAVANVDRSREATTLANSAAQVGEADRRFPHQTQNSIKRLSV
jgi:hypothetical protein